MLRVLGRLLTFTAVAVAVVLACLTAASSDFGVVGAGAANADTCLASPILLLSQVAQVAGINSALWADIQQVEQAAATQASSDSGQVLQEMLNVVTRDGYQWDCASSQLTAVPGAAHPPNPTTTTPPPTDPPTTSAAVASEPTVPPTTNAIAALSPVGASTRSNSGKLPVILLLLLLLGSAGLLVVVFRRQMFR